MNEKHAVWIQWLSAAQSIVGVGCAAALLGGTKQTGYSALWVAVLILVWVGSLAFWREDDRRGKACFGVLGFVFSLCCALGMRLDAAQETGWAALALCTLAGGCFGAAAAEGFWWFVRLLMRLKTPLKISETRAFWIAFVILLLCWAPVVVTLFPGVDGYDIDAQRAQILYQTYNTHHPLLHTLYLQVFFYLGELLFESATIGFGLSTLVQAVLVAFAIAWALRSLQRLNCPKALWIALLALFALSPQHSVLVSSSIKDVPFAAVMLLLCVELIRFLREPDRMGKPAAWAANILLICLACLLRNNAVYALLLVLLLGIVLWRKKLGRSAVLLLCAGVIAGVGCAAGLKAATHAGEGSIREMLCVPCQQLARIYSIYGLEHPVGYEIREVLPYVEDYTPERADAVKRAAKVFPNDRLLRFVKLWGRELFRYPTVYIDAFLLNTKAYWWVDDLSYTTTYGEGPLVLWHNEATGLQTMNLWPKAKAICYELVAANGYQRYPVLWTLIQPALYSWLLALALCWACWKRHKAVLLAGGLCLAYLLTLLLGPCAIIRYQYSLMLCAPVLLACLRSQSAAEG